MNVTKASVVLNKQQGNVKAFASIVFDDALALHGVRVVDAKGKTIVAMPSRKTKDGKYRDICHPISVEFRAQIEKAVMDQYNVLIAQPPAVQPEEVKPT